MIRTGNFFLFILLLFAALPAVAGEVHFDATVSDAKLAVGENLNLNLTVSSDSSLNDEEPRLPDLQGFELLTKWTESRSSSVFENGKFLFKREQIYHYTLSPQKAGKLVIGPAEVSVKGQTLKTKPIDVTVVAANGQPRSNTARNQKHAQEEDDSSGMGGLTDDDEDLFTQLLKRRGLLLDHRGGVKSAPDDNHEVFFLAVEANKGKAYVGEEIIATWYIYTRGNIQAFDPLKYPDLKGFWKEDLELATRLNMQSEVVNGVPYNKALLVSYALFPIGPGKKTIDPFKAKATVIELSSPMGMFGIGHPFTITKASKELNIKVMPLPDGKPASFTGAVGQFTVTGSVSGTQVKVNQPVSLKIRFQGKGNVKAIELPALNLPPNIELFDTKKDSQFFKTGEGFKEFEVLLIPRSQGDLTIPKIDVSYFDPSKAKYVTSSTPEFKIHVLPGDGSNPPQNYNAPINITEGGQPDQPPALKDIRYLKTSSSFALPTKAQKLLWAALFLLGWGYFGVQLIRVGRGPKDSRTLLRERVKAKLKAARIKLKKGDVRGVGIECSNAVLSSLGDVVGLGGASLVADEMLKKLPPGNEQLIGDVKKFLSQCEILSFAPDELLKGLGDQAGSPKSLIATAERIISRLFELGNREESASQASSSAANQ